MESVTKELSVAEAYVEIHHTRGNISYFEKRADPDSEEWEEADVWEYRRAAEEWWAMGFVIQDAIPDYNVFRVTRYPDLEKDLLDTTYHPSVESWKINPTKVKEYFSERIN